MLQTGTPPVANAGPDQTVSTGLTGQASILLDASGSTGTGTKVYTWRDGATVVSSGTSPTALVTMSGFGAHGITLTVSNAFGTTSDAMTVTLLIPTSIGPQGPQGNTGATGAQGPAGADGAIGPQGLQGLTGATGAQDPAGTPGADGAPGAPGAPGANGAIGAQGPQGLQGPAGATGAAGTDGAPGTPGAQGVQGPAGPMGPMGPIGPTGTLVVPPGTIIELRAGSPAPAGYRLLFRGIEKYQLVDGNNGDRGRNDNRGGQVRLLVDVYEKM